MKTPGTTASEIRSFVQRIQNLETEIKELNSDKSGIYGEAKSKGFDVPALKAVIAYLRKDANTRSEERQVFELYLSNALGTDNATRARSTPQVATSNKASINSPDNTPTPSPIPEQTESVADGSPSDDGEDASCRTTASGQREPESHPGLHASSPIPDDELNRIPNFLNRAPVDLVSV